MKVAISIGDPNGIGLEIALKSHERVKKLCKPIYCVDDALLQEASKLLQIKVPHDFTTAPLQKECPILPGKISKEAGGYSFSSFLKAIELAKTKDVEAIVTLPIHKEAWSLAGIAYKGHTDALRDIFKQDAIMMLGCEELYVALFTEHIPLKEVASKIELQSLESFFEALYHETKASKVAVLALNPHAGDGGVLGNEEEIISHAIKNINEKLQQEIFVGPIVPDIAFTPNFRSNFTTFVAMYHDQGLAPLKALYFDKSINISLNLPIKRVSVDHGTAFDIAYQGRANTQSYLECFSYLLN